MVVETALATTMRISCVLPSVGSSGPFSSTRIRRPASASLNAAAAPPAPEPTMIASNSVSLLDLTGRRGRRANAARERFGACSRLRGAGKRHADACQPPVSKPG